jgi:hypothetical protein
VDMTPLNVTVLSCGFEVFALLVRWSIIAKACNFEMNGFLNTSVD